jgi:hypothetical protein
MQKEINVLAALDCAMQLRGYLMPYLNYWPTLHDFVGEIILRHCRTNTWGNIQRKFDKPVMC